MGELLLYLQPYLVPIKDIFTIISLCVAAVVAIRGLDAWKKQLHGTQAYDLAKRVLTNVYTLRDALKFASFPYSTLEADIAKKEIKIETSLKDPQYEIKTFDAVIQVRWKIIEEAQKKLEVEAMEAEALWGQRAKTAIINICQMAIARRDLIVEYIDAMYKKEPSSDLDPNLEKLQKRIRWNPLHLEGEEFLQQLTIVTTVIESIVFPYLTKNQEVNKRLKSW